MEIKGSTSVICEETTNCVTQTSSYNGELSQQTYGVVSTLSHLAGLPFLLPFPSCLTQVGLTYASFTPDVRQRGRHAFILLC